VWGLRAEGKGTGGVYSAIPSVIAPWVHTPKLASRWFHVVVSPLIPRGLPRGSSLLSGGV